MYYQRDSDQLDAFWRGEMSFRRLFILLKNLPDRSPLQKSFIGVEEFNWTPEMRLQASIVESVQYVAWLIGAVNSDKFRGKKNPVPKPKPIPRPGVAESEKRQGKMVLGGKNPTSTKELAAFFGGAGRG